MASRPAVHAPPFSGSQSERTRDWVAVNAICCDAPNATWFRIETAAEAATGSDLMRHAVEKRFRELEPSKTGDDQILLERPSLDLAADLAIPVGMALHELTTNSVKYGALSTAYGRVAVTWELKHTDGRRRLHLKWRESGGPPIRAPERKGFGTTMSERILPAQAEADVQIEFIRRDCAL